MIRQMHKYEIQLNRNGLRDTTPMPQVIAVTDELTYETALHASESIHLLP